MASAKRLATLMTLQHGGKLFEAIARWYRCRRSSLIGLRAILAAEPFEKTPWRDAGVDVLAAAFLAGEAISIRVPPEIVKSSTIRTFLPFDVADDFEHLGLLVVARGGSCCR